MILDYNDNNEDIEQLKKEAPKHHCYLLRFKAKQKVTSDDKTTPGKLTPILSFEAYPKRHNLLPLSLFASF